MMIPPISHYMTSRPHVVTSRDPLAKARDLMTAHSIHHLPVVDHGRLVGIITDDDLDRTRSYDEHVSDAMADDFTAVDDTLPLDEAVTLMNTNHQSSLLITSKTSKAGITGIFTVSDAMRAFAEILRSEAGDQ